MTRTTSTREKISREQIKYIIAVIETSCTMLMALIPILKKLMGEELPPSAK